MDAVGGAECGAHHAGDALDAAALVAVEAVDAAEVAGLKAADLGREVLAADFGILHRSVGAAGAEGGDEVAEGGAEALDDFGEVGGLGAGHHRGFHHDEIFGLDRHKPSISPWHRASARWVWQNIARKGDATKAKAHRPEGRCHGDTGVC